MYMYRPSDFPDGSNYYTPIPERFGRMALRWSLWGIAWVAIASLAIAVTAAIGVPQDFVYMG
jgi:hypothetical protein